ncbi:hypothetical protein Salat_0263000 [Sesamum alatum]|uniref:Uncharacterized protein n=1 Tax=Sesamum alatum TaxID=300844 RepID=A0AAE2CYH3_9LAMI|nr:hypothetical protein Salat_0263000 [Sesamum alatum]
MASCNGLSHSFLPCSTGFAKIGKRKPARIVSFYGAARKQQRNTKVGGAAPTSGPSSLHPEKFGMEYEEQIEEIRQVLRSKGEDDPSESLVLADAIQREMKIALRKLQNLAVAEQFGGTTSKLEGLAVAEQLQSFKAVPSFILQFQSMAIFLANF